MSTGYCNPPEETRFKKGKSGNPKGRPLLPKRAVSAAFMFRKVAQEMVLIEMDGQRTPISHWDAYIRAVYAMALNKNTGASRLLNQLREQFPGETPPGDPVTYLICKEDEDL